AYRVEFNHGGALYRCGSMVAGLSGRNKKARGSGLFMRAFQRNRVRYSSIRLNRLRTGGFGSCSTFSTGAAGFGVAGAVGFSATTGAAAGTFGFGSAGGLVSAFAAGAPAGVGAATFGFGGAFGFVGGFGFPRPLGVG